MTTATRETKVQAYNLLALKQRMRECKIGSPRWQQAKAEYMEAYRKATIEAKKLESQLTTPQLIGTDWVSELSKL